MVSAMGYSVLRMLALESFFMVRRIVYAIALSGWVVVTAVILYHFLFSK